MTPKQAKTMVTEAMFNETKSANERLYRERERLKKQCSQLEVMVRELRYDIAMKSKRIAGLEKQIKG